jgi:16S rRNA (uracil1498-N3)-methyltransferase
MTRRRWIADESSESRAALTGAHADHLIRVLRAKVGQEFEISTAGRIRLGRITAIHAGRVEFELADDLPLNESIDLTLLLSIFKFDRMEWAIEKCTELGVARIVPLVAHRCDAHLVAAAEKRVERWRRLAREAAEQSRRAHPPDIAAPVRVRESLAIPGGTHILLSETEQERSLKDVLAGIRQPNIVQAIGPEGGWTAQENDAFLQAGWISASLGRTILRSETAAIVSAALVALSR